MPKFVLLTHDWPTQHFDFMLEESAHLLTWRFPTTWQMDSISFAEELPHHRCHYLSYEGPISGDRGQVERYDKGEYVWVERKSDFLSVELFGEKCNGDLQLIHQDHLWKIRWRPRSIPIRFLDI